MFFDLTLQSYITAGLGLCFSYADFHFFLSILSNQCTYYTNEFLFAWLVCKEGLSISSLPWLFWMKNNYKFSKFSVVLSQLLCNIEMLISLIKVLLWPHNVWIFDYTPYIHNNIQVKWFKYAIYQFMIRSEVNYYSVTIITESDSLSYGCFLYFPSINCI